MDRDKRGIDPADALAFALPPRPELADRLVTPRWHHPVMGVAVALLTGSWGTHLAPVVIGSIVLWFAVAVTLPRLYRRATGVWVVGEVPPEARRWARALTWTTLGGAFLGMSVGPFDGPVRLLSAVLAVLAFVLVQVLGRRFDDALREALRKDPEIAFKIDEADA